MHRRQLLKVSALSLAGMALPWRLARAAEASKKSFVFVFASGGWDPTRVLSTEFGHPNVDMEPDAELNGAGGLSWVEHWSRPSVGTFFSGYHDRCLILNGVLVRSIAHEICTLISMTGSTSGMAPDWGAILADARREDVTLPHLVLGGPSFPGALGGAVVRSGLTGQLEGLLSGRILDEADIPPPRPVQAFEDRIDRYVLSRVNAFSAAAPDPRTAELAGALSRSAHRAVDLKQLRHVMDFSTGEDLEGQVDVAVAVLQRGLCRCITLGHGNGLWDSHVDNDATQTVLWESLFRGLGRLVQKLDLTSGPTGRPLSEDTVVVVLSEMGRTPLLNGFGGKDHWPWTSVLMVGPGITGDRVVGGFDEQVYGVELDYGTGEPMAGGSPLSAEALGATLLALGDVDPGAWIKDAEPVLGLLG